MKAKPTESAEAASAFFAEEEHILSDIAGGCGFTFKRGESWDLNPETGEVSYDPRFFEERGYTPSEALFGAFHAIKCHLVETMELISSTDGQKAHERLKARASARPHLRIWEDCRTDIKGNLAIIRFAPALADGVQAIHRQKLYPERDFTTKPRHLQFMYAILRTAMVPDDPVVVDSLTSEAIAGLRGLRGRDVISLATDPLLDPLLALRLSEKYIEPVIEELYRRDVEDNNEDNKDRDPERDGEQNGEKPEPFADEYRDFENRNPQPIDEGTLERKIKEAHDRQSEAARQAAGYEAEHGISKKDAGDYRQEYKKVERFIEPLRDVFQQIIEQRKIPLRRLAALKEDGVIIDPGLVAQTYLDVRAGILNPRTMKDFERRFEEQNAVARFSLRLVADQSGSMLGDKSIHQRRSAILVMEALKEFADILDAERARLAIDLAIETELRSFGVAAGTRLYKALSAELSEKQRLEFFRGLVDTRGGTNDFDALAEIERDIRRSIAQDAGYAVDLKSGRRRELVIVLSDGDSADVGEVQKRSRSLRDLGVKVIGLGMGNNSQSIEDTYRPDGRICADVSDLPRALQEALSECLGQLMTTRRT